MTDYSMMNIASDISELKDILEAKTQLDLLNDLYIHEMITEGTYKLGLESLATRLHMSIKYLK